MRRIITDLDDTVITCSDALQGFIEEEFGMTSEQRLKDTHDIPKLFGIDLKTTLEIIARFHRSPHMECLPADPSAAEALPELHRQGYSFVAISACLNEPEVVEARLRNLWTAFGFEWEAVHCIGLTPCKKAALRLYPPGLWVDDLAHHAMAGAEAGHRSFLMNKMYNQGEHANVTRVNDWHDLIQHL